MIDKVQNALEQLAEIDEIILKDSYSLPAYDRFMSLVHQKEGLIDLIQQETGQTPYWTKDGYYLRSEKE